MEAKNITVQVTDIRVAKDSHYLLPKKMTYTFRDMSADPSDEDLRKRINLALFQQFGVSPEKDFKYTIVEDH